VGFRFTTLEQIAKEEEEGMTVVAEKRLYETPKGELVEEVEDSGSLFCAIGSPLVGEEAARYEAYMAESKAVHTPPEDKAVRQAKNK
jgi:hypothetical protein